MTTEPLRLTPDLVTAYIAWCRAQAVAAKREVNERWLRAKELHLDWWMFALTDRDLTKLRLADILGQLEGATDRAKRIVVIKHLYTFLRMTDRIEAGEDPTVGGFE